MITLNELNDLNKMLSSFEQKNKMYWVNALVEIYGITPSQAGFLIYINSL